MRNRFTFLFSFYLRVYEINPIELIFNILVKRLKSYHYRSVEGVKEYVIEKAGSVLDEIAYETIL